MDNYTPNAEPKAWADGVPVYCAHDAIVDVAVLVPNPKNPNQHPDEQIRALGRIIREPSQGWRNPITVSTRSAFIVKGHGRLAAALLEGFKEVPVDYQNYASEAAEYSDLVADNRIAELAEIDQKMLADIFADIDTGEIPLELTGYTEKEVENLVTALSEAINNDLTEPDEVPEPPEPENTITQTGDLWILGHHRLLCGDSTNRQDEQPLMDGAKADIVVTDPPYALFGNSTGVCGVGDDKMIMPFFREIGRMIHRHLKQMGHAYVCHDFGGSGSTLISCEQLYRNCYIMEMAPKYCDVIVKRYIKTTGKTSGIQLIRKGESMGREYFESMFSE